MRDEVKNPLSVPIFPDSAVVIRALRFRAQTVEEVSRAVGYSQGLTRVSRTLRGLKAHGIACEWSDGTWSLTHKLPDVLEGEWSEDALKALILLYVEGNPGRYEDTYGIAHELGQDVERVYYALVDLMLEGFFSHADPQIGPHNYPDYYPVELRNAYRFEHWIRWVYRPQAVDKNDRVKDAAVHEIVGRVLEVLG